MTPTHALALALGVIRDEIDRRMLVYDMMIRHKLEREEGAADEYPLSVRELRTAIAMQAKRKVSDDNG